MKRDWKAWAIAALIRAAKTFFQTFASFITVGVAFFEIDWGKAASVAAVAGVYSLITSLGGLPEVKPPDNDYEDDVDTYDAALIKEIEKEQNDG